MPEVPTRSEFLFMPGWQIVLFYVMISASVLFFGWQVLGRVRVWLKGQPIGWQPDYVGGVVRYVLGQRKVRTSRVRSGAPMHVLIFYGFLTLFIGTTLLAINTYSPWKFHRGNYYLVYEFTLDVMGLSLLVGLIWAMLRRSWFRPVSLTSAPGDFVTLWLLLIITLTGYLVEAARMSAVPKSFDTSAPVGYWLSTLLPTVTPPVYISIWWFHAVLVAIFIAVIPRLRLRHIAYAIFSSAGSDPHAKLGELKPITIEQVEQTERVGVIEATDYSRWHLMSLDACMECGRCTEVCPAWNVGKSLNPKEVVQSIREATHTGVSVSEALTEDVIWACTTCNACVDACPVLIRHVDMIVDARRNLVAEGRLGGTAAVMLRQLQSSSSAWGIDSSERESWMSGYSIPLARDLVNKGESFEVLLWVGCAGAVDKNAIQTIRSLAVLMKQAGVKFACLGKEEVCTGDPARRLGDEFLFQEFAKQNIQTFEQYGVKKIVTSCPHCFNTIKNEYPQFDGEYAVIHHSQLLEQLISEGRLKAPDLKGQQVTLHDPCYLARANNESDAPRRSLGVASNYNGFDTPVARYLNVPMSVGSEIVEPQHHAQKTLCCGAGGGRMWMEEDRDQRPSVRRIRELVSTGATQIAVACPFCHIMLDAGLQQESLSETIELTDIVEFVRRANS